MLSDEKKPRIRYKDYKIAQAFGGLEEKKILYKPKVKPVIITEQDRKLKAEIDRLELTLERLKGIEILNLRPLTPKEKAKMVLLGGRIKVLKGQLLAKKDGDK